jgi:hypothetical protein
MGKVTASAVQTITASADRVIAALGDYNGTRAAMLTEHFSEYEVRDGGKGAGTVVHWKLAATSKRVRDCLITVTAPSANTLVETDANSSMVTTWTVLPAGDGKSSVTVETTWNGASGIGGFFERTFAPGGLKKIYDAQLAKLEAAL